MIEVMWFGEWAWLAILALPFVAAWTAPRTWVAAAVLTAAQLNTDVRDNENILKTSINDSGYLSFVDATELTISAGAVTVTQNYHKIDTEADAASDDLDTITAGANVVAGHVLHLRVESGARTVVLKHTSGGGENLDLGADITLDETHTTYTLVYDGTNWRPFTFPGLLPTRAYKSLISSGAVMPASGTRYSASPALQEGSATEAQATVDIPIPVTFSNLYVHRSDGTGSVVVTLRKAAADTTLTVTLAATVIAGSDTANSVSFVAGDDMVWSFVSTGMTANETVSLMAEVLAD